MIQCEKILLQKAITAVSRAAKARSTMPALQGLLFHCEYNSLTVTGYDLKTGIRCTIPADTSGGDFVLDARLVSNVVKQMPDDLIEITPNHETVHFKGGDAKFVIPAMDHKDYPDLPDADSESSLVIQQNTLKTMIDEILYAVSTNESRPVYTGILFDAVKDNLTMVGLDGFRMAIRKEKLGFDNGDTFSFVAPGAAMNEVKRLCDDTEDTAKISVGKQHILFELGATELICRRVEGQFLDYNSVIPKENTIVAIVDTRAAIESVSRVSVVISERYKAPVRCQLDGNCIVMSAQTATGAATDNCRIQRTDYNGGNLEIGFNGTYLLEALRHAPSDNVQMGFSNSVSPCIITNGHNDAFLYMVLPVRLKAE